jgi:hypothetical protein
MYSTVKVPFPSEKYAETAMKTIGVDPVFSDSKNKKNTIERQMFTETLEDGTTYLTVELTCDRSEAQMLRTCASSFYTNLMLVCETMVMFGT